MPTPLQILRQYKIEPRRSRGQNFLIDQNILDKIIANADLKKTDVVAEIGAGVGFLTKELASRVKKVFAVEIDEKLLQILHSSAREKNIMIIAADARTLPNKTFGTRDGSYRVIANIPYNLTSLLIEKFLEEIPRPRDMLLMIQKEVGERICAKPGAMSVLSALTQYYATPRILFSVSRNCFFPRPQVDSACISLLLKKDKEPHTEEARIFTALVKAGFARKRKLLARNLSHAFNIPYEEVRKGFEAADISLTARAQELSVENWLELVSRIYANRAWSC